MIFKAIFLGIIQGITEFLPVSSTGHLILVEHWLGISQATFGLTFDVALHLGTLAALFWYFWGEIGQLVKEDIKRVKPIRRRGQIEKLSGLFTTKVVVATIPAAGLGLVLEPYVVTFFRQPALVAWALILFSLVIWWADRKRGEMGEIREISVCWALVIGVFQALALFPGVSRSGATMSGGLFLGLKRQASARFAFLLSIPVIFGASVKQLIQAGPVLATFSTAQLSFFVIGFATAGFFSFLTIKYFLAYLKFARLWPFVVYRIGLGLLILLLF